MDPKDITNITVAQPEHCMLVSWELVDRFMYLPQDQEYISSAFSQVFNYTRWKKVEKICLTSFCWSPPVTWKESIVTIWKEWQGLMETQPSTENASSRAGEGNASFFQKPLLRQKKAGSNLSLADHLRGGHFNNNWFAHASCPFSPGSLWPLPRGPGSRVKGVGVCEPWARWHFRGSATSYRVSGLQQKTG